MFLSFQLLHELSLQSSTKLLNQGFRSIVRRFLAFYMLLSVSLVSAYSYAEESDVAKKAAPALELKSTIVGNQEQPEVIYIVPWKQIDAPAPEYKPLRSMVDGQFKLLDRDEWRRKIDLEKTLSHRADPDADATP